MNPEGSRIGIVFNGSPLFTGDAGSGESEIRKWIIENDWLECIVSLPDRMFFNTGITTYVWIVTNKKSSDRKGNVQLIDGTSFSTSMRKNLGDKGKYITEEQIQELFEIYQNNEENEFCKIYPNSFFGYTKVVVEQPLIEDGDIKTDKKGNPKPDTSKRDSERVLLSENVDEYYDREVKPHIPDSWMDRSKDKIGYEINFTKYFYKFTPLRSLEDISQDLKSLDDEIKRLSMEMTGEISILLMYTVPIEWICHSLWSLFQKKSYQEYRREKLILTYSRYGVILKDSRDDNHNKVSRTLQTINLLNLENFVLEQYERVESGSQECLTTGIVSPVITCLEPGKQIHNKYFHYLLRSEFIDKVYESFVWIRIESMGTKIP